MKLDSLVPIVSRSLRKQRRIYLGLLVIIIGAVGWRLAGPSFTIVPRMAQPVLLTASETHSEAVKIGGGQKAPASVVTAESSSSSTPWKVWQLPGDENRLVGAAVGRIAKRLGDMELKRTKFQHFETATGSVIRAEIARPLPDEDVSIRELLQSELQALPPEAQPYAMVDAKRMIEKFRFFPEPTKVVIRVLETATGGEENWFYEFDTDKPEQFGIEPSPYMVNLPPPHDLVLSRSKWFENPRASERFGHLFPIND